MSEVIIRLKIMPKSPEINLEDLKPLIQEKITKFGGKVGKIEQEPIAFGLKALFFIFFLDESKSNIDPLEEDIKSIGGVNSAEVVNITKAL